MRRIISALLICFSSAWAFAQDTKPLELAPNAPDRHIVVPGDTLWGIASQFLKDPYRWPDIWRLNADEIKNPQRIFPGQVIVLDNSGDEPLLKLGELVKAEPHIYVSEPPRAIPAIQQNAIEPFLSRPLAVDAGTLDSAARIVAMQGGKINVGSGDLVYATKVKDKNPLWQIFRSGSAMPNPDKPDDILGYEAVSLGTARLVSPGEPATLEIVSSSREIGHNDYLVPMTRPEIISYVPHAPTQPIAGRIISIYGSVGTGGRLSIVSLSRGKQDGLEIGHVLAIFRTGTEVTNRVDDRKETYQLPDERYGMVFVFRVFERISYGLIMDAARPVTQGDIVRTP